MQILVLETPSLGDRSYVVHDGVAAAVIDPQRDIDRVFALVEERRLTVAAVFETHVHNDDVTGGYELATKTGARYYLNAVEQLDSPFDAISGGEQ